MRLPVCLAFALTLSAYACKARQEGLARLAADQGAGGADELGASDLSIFVPLQAIARTNPNKSVFGKNGTGMCNAPGLDLGGANPLMTKAQWQDWAKDVLLSVLPLPEADAAWDGGTKPPLDDLKRGMQTLADVDTDVECPEPLGADKMAQDVTLLRQAGTNVAVAQSLPAGACRYSHWRIVSARFEPCSWRAKVLEDSPSSLNNVDNVPDTCGGSEFRLVAQPFVPDAGGKGYRGLDMAMHLFYKLENAGALLDDLRAMREVTRASLAGKTGDGANSVWYEDKKDLLLPHPGLREEMECGGKPLGNGGDASLGPVGKEWRRILTKYAGNDKLFKITWVTSDNSGGNWSFGLRLAQPGAGGRKVTRGESYKVETFTAAQVGKDFPYTPFDPTMTSVDYFYRAGANDTSLASDAGKTATKELIDIANPDKTTFNLGGKLGASCASCHTRDQTERAVRQRTGKTHAELAAIGGTTAIDTPLWEPFRAAIEDRNVNNVRNFGYGPAMSFGVSRRAVNETEVLRRVVNGAPSPTAGSGASLNLADEAAGEASPDWERDIRPLLMTRCGYCHGIKREPALLDKGQAENYAGMIVDQTGSDVLAAAHMPPGKVLPEAEKALLKRWAEKVGH